MQDPIEFLRNTFPQIFSKGVALLRHRAASGDARASKQLQDVSAVTGSAALQIDNRAPVHLGVSNAEIMFSEQPISGSPVKIVAQVPGQALSVLLGRALEEGALEKEEVAVGATQIVSKRLEDMLANRQLTCRLMIEGVPDLGRVEATLGFNVTEIPAAPGFSATLAYQDLQLAQQGKVNMQELFMGGKLKMEGDYSLALQIAVQMMTNPM